MGNHVEDLNKYAVRIKEGQRVLRQWSIMEAEIM